MKGHRPAQGIVDQREPCLPLPLVLRQRGQAVAEAGRFLSGIDAARDQLRAQISSRALLDIPKTLPPGPAGHVLGGRLSRADPPHPFGSDPQQGKLRLLGLLWAGPCGGGRVSFVGRQFPFHAHQFPAQEGQRPRFAFGQFFDPLLQSLPQLLPHLPGLRPLLGGQCGGSLGGMGHQPIALHSHIDRAIGAAAQHGPADLASSGGLYHITDAPLGPPRGTAREEHEQALDQLQQRSMR